MQDFVHQQYWEVGGTPTRSKESDLPPELELACKPFTLWLQLNLHVFLRRRCDFIQELQRAVNLYSRGGRDVLPEIYEYVEAPTIGNSHIGAFIITCLYWFGVALL